MIDPLDAARRTREIVCRREARKYYRFRAARFYGGIATADCVGCCLRCVFCWSFDVVAHPEARGEFRSPEEVTRVLLRIAGRKRLRRLRISGNEPTLAREHLLAVLERVPGDLLFILETNGVLIGSDRSYAEDLAAYPNLHVRVSLKGTCEEEFARLTGAVPGGFGLQLAALESLASCGVSCHPACMVAFSPPGNVAALRKRLRAIRPAFEAFEAEELILYPAVEERLRKLGIPYLAGHRPDRVPEEQV